MLHHGNGTHIIYQNAMQTVLKKSGVKMCQMEMWWKLTIESIKTTSMKTVSTGVLDENKEHY